MFVDRDAQTKINVNTYLPKKLGQKPVSQLHPLPLPPREKKKVKEMDLWVTADNHVQDHVTSPGMCRK